MSPFDESLGKNPEDRYKIVIPFTEETKERENDFNKFTIKQFGIFNNGNLLVADNYSHIHLFDSKDEYAKLGSKELEGEMYGSHTITMRHWKAKD